MQGSLQTNLNRLSRDFNAEISSACRSLAPGSPQPGAPLPEAEFLAAWQRAKITRHSQMFQRIALALPEDGTLVLRNFALDREVFETVDWPPALQALQQRLEARLQPQSWDGPRPPAPGSLDRGSVFELPLFGSSQPGPPPMPFGGHEVGWLIFEVNVAYVRDALLPELLQRHLGAGGSLDYDVEVVTQDRTPSVIYRSDSSPANSIASTADASVGLFDVQYDQIFRRRDMSGGRDRGPGRALVSAAGRWQLYVRHRAGSLDAVVSRARLLNLAVTAGVLLLIVASIAALIHYTRQAQRLASLQMDFVASVSHELRTPLTVIHTAAYNLQGALARNPNQVERYGALIQKESGRLKELVEQALRFAGARAGRVIQQPEPLAVEAVIDDTVESTRAAMQGARCVVETSIDPGLPLVLGDPIALKHALENLISNAAKYGTESSNWIGVSASHANCNGQDVIEIRVADRGPGIPLDEQTHIFDPFFRGKRAVQDQVHGTGLGLSLVKDIVEAHGGAISVQSEPAKGTEFIVRIPVAPAEQQDEFAHSLG